MLEETVESSGVEQTGGASSPEQASPSPAQSEGQSHEATAQGVQTPAEEQRVPYSRFQEMVQQKNEIARQAREHADQLQALQARLAQLEKGKETSTKQEDPLLAELKQVNPVFAERFEKLLSMESKMTAFEKWQAEQGQQQLAMQAASKLDTLYKQNNVSDELKEWYDSKIQATVYQLENSGKKLGVQDLDNIFKQVHDSTTKFLEARDRKQRESYVSDKKKDMAPATQTGGSPAPIGKGAEFNNASDVKAAIAKHLRQANQKI